MRPKKPKWREVRSVKDAKPLIESHTILKWVDARYLAKNLSLELQSQILTSLVDEMGKNTENRFLCEVLTESTLLWLAAHPNEQLIKAVADYFLSDEKGLESCTLLVEIGLGTEFTDAEHQDRVVEIAVLLGCEISKSLVLKSLHIDEQKRIQKFLAHITTYLLSVSNFNSYAIRLSLIHYFGVLSREGYHQADFERVMNRFGYTVLDFVFSLLFKKKTEGLALQYLLENIPLTLEADGQTQKIIHEIFKYYLFKMPDRFSLFLQTLGDQLAKDTRGKKARQIYLKHLGALLRVVAKLNHKALSEDLLTCIYRTDDPFIEEIHQSILADPMLSKDHKQFAQKLYADEERGKRDALDLLRLHKRGRHPSFHAIEKLDFIDQVAQLGAKHHARL